MMSTVSEKLLQVAQNNPKVYHAGQLNIVKNAECLKNNKSSSAMLLDDVSPVTHDMGVKVRGNNLFSLANRTWANFGANASTTVRNISKDNFYFKITANNYANNSTTNYEILNGNSIKITTTNAYGLGVPFHLIAGQQYTISCIKSDDIKCRINIGYYDIEGNYLSGEYDISTFTMPENAFWAMLCFTAFMKSGTAEELTFSNIQLELGTTATDYEPYNNDIQNVHSKNLIPYPYTQSTQTINGITFTVSSDGSITANGTATSNAYLGITSISTFYIPKGDYILSGCPSGGSSTTYNLVAVNDTGASYTKFRQDIGNGITLSSSGEYWIIRCQVMAGQTVENLTFKPQLELGSTATYYEKYHEPYPLVVSRYGKNLFNQYAESKFINPYRGIVVSDFCNNANSAMYTLSVSLKQGATFQEGINFGLIRMNKSNGSSAQWFQTKTDTNFRFTYTSMNSLDHIPDFYVALVGIYPSTEDNWNRIINNYNIQIEYGKPPTDYEPYKECADYTPNADGTVEGVTSLCPNTTLLTNDPYGKVYIDCEYYKDVDKAFDELTTSVALSGGDS